MPDDDRLKLAEERRRIEVYIRGNFSVGRRKAAGLVRFFIGGEEITEDAVLRGLQALIDEQEQKRKENSSVTSEPSLFRDDTISIFNEHNKKINCTTCDKRFKADALSKAGRKRLQARVCSEECWNIVSLYAVKKASKEGITVNESFNIILCQLLRRYSNGKSNKTNDGRTSGNAFLGA